MKDIEINPDLEQLRGYTQHKQALAGQLRLIKQGLTALGREGAVDRCGELAVKLVEDRFTLAVVGQFKRGKSSLMNAIIGRELLPTGVLPLTSAITVLRYGPSEQLLVFRSNLSFPEKLPLAVLPDYVTEKGNPGNSKKLLTARIELPVPFLRYGVEFVDTPGIGSAIAANTATTYDFLPQCDALLFVTSADSPMTSGELSFLEDIRAYVGKIFFVVNKMDLLSEGERKEVLSYVEETVRQKTGAAGLKIFGLSSKEGLEARIGDDEGRYERSGLKALEEELGAFLSREKSAAFLEGIVQKAARIVDGEAAGGAFDEPALEVRATELRDQRVRTIQQEPHVAVMSILDARGKLEALQREIKGEPRTGTGQTDTVQNGRTDKVFTGGQVYGAPLVEAQADLPADAPAEMRSELREKSCPVCVHMRNRAQDFLIQWQYELGSLEAAQDLFADELGFCPLHAWQLVSISSPYGASVGYARLAERMAARLREAQAEEKVGRLVRDARTCRVCGLVREAEADYVGWLAGQLGGKDGPGSYRQSAGACLRHLGMLIAAAPGATFSEFLLSDTAERFARDAEDMRSYALKRDALRRSLQNSEEEDAYYRTMIRIAGDRMVYVPWPEDGEI